MTLCGITFPVHHLPGHSLDHIVIGTPDGVCFAGDALLTENVLRHVKLPYCDHVGLDLESKEATQNYLTSTGFYRTKVHLMVISGNWQRKIWILSAYVSQNWQSFCRDR